MAMPVMTPPPSDAAKKVNGNLAQNMATNGLMIAKVGGLMYTSSEGGRVYEYAHVHL